MSFDREGAKASPVIFGKYSNVSSPILRKVVHFPPVSDTRPLSDTMTLWEREISLVLALPSLGLARGLSPAKTDRTSALDGFRVKYPAAVSNTKSISLCNASGSRLAF